MSTKAFTVNGHFKKQQVTGVQRYAIELLNEFNKQDVKYDVVESSLGTSSDSIRQLWMQAAMPLKVPKDRLLWSPTNIGPVFHMNQVVTLHDIADQLHPEWFSSKYVNWRKLILPNLLRRVKGIITVSNFSKETILQVYPQASGKIKVIYNGARTDHFYKRSGDELSAIRKKFSLSKPYVITVGSLDPRKNIQTLVRAWGELPESIRSEMDLVIVGGASDIFSFNIDRALDDSIRFLGYVDYEMLPALYSASEFFIYPSLFEGFGLPVLEAMACKVPVITSNKTSLGELAEGYALTVNTENSHDISDAIQTLYNSEEVRKRYTALGYEHAQTFTWQLAAQKTLSFFNEIDN